MLAVRREAKRWQKVARMYFLPKPFRSYDVDNELDSVVSSTGFRRTFRLAHAVTTEFVEALYKGLEGESTKTDLELGQVWLEHQQNVAPDVRKRWQQFLSSRSGSLEFSTVITEIHNHLRQEMKTDEVIRALSNGERCAQHDGGCL